MEDGDVWRADLGKGVEDVLVGFAVVNLQGEAAALGDFDVRAEGFLLRVHVRAVGCVGAEVVESGFADDPHAFTTGEFVDFSQGFVQLSCAGKRGRFVGMQGDSTQQPGPSIFGFGGHDVGCPAGGRQVASDLDYSFDAGRHGGFVEERQRRELFVFAGHDVFCDDFAGLQRQAHAGADVQVGVGVNTGRCQSFGYVRVLSRCA